MATEDGKKKIAALIVAGMPKHEDSTTDESSSDQYKDGDENDDDEKSGDEAAEESCFGEFRAALKSGNDKAGLAALRELMGYAKDEK